MEHITVIHLGGGKIECHIRHWIDPVVMHPRRRDDASQINGCLHSVRAVCNVEIATRRWSVTDKPIQRDL